MRKTALLVALAAFALAPALAQEKADDHHPSGLETAPQERAPAPGAAQSPRPDEPGATAGAGGPMGEMRAIMQRMHDEMMRQASHADAEEAFVRGMIPHHQAAIDMAHVLARHGKDEEILKLAADVVREQTREIEEMREWLRRHGREASPAPQ